MCIDVEIVLTFDDGPHNVAGNCNRTEQVLDTLANNTTAPGINSVFFIQSHARADTNKWNRGKSTEGTRLLKRALSEGHLVQIHTGADIIGAHALLSDHPRRKASGELVGDLERCAEFIEGLKQIDPHVVRFVRPPFGDYRNPGVDVLPTYTSQGLKMILWDIDSGDTGKTNGRRNTPENVRDILYNGVRAAVDGGATNLIILFHDLDDETYPYTYLNSYIEKIDRAVRDEGENPVWILIEERIREIMENKDWVGDDPNH